MTLRPAFILSAIRPKRLSKIMAAALVEVARVADRMTLEDLLSHLCDILFVGPVAELPTRHGRAVSPDAIAFCSPVEVVRPPARHGRIVHHIEWLV